MLNLKPIFKHAITVLEQHSNNLVVLPLPCTIFMMQRDVINHYRYAMTHYFDLTLNEPYLQNSSLGTPYEKWAKFSNRNFEMLTFSIHNLLRYTSRLIHDASVIDFMSRYGHDSEMRDLNNSYIAPICEINGDVCGINGGEKIIGNLDRNKTIGIHIKADNVLVRTPFAFESCNEGQISSHSKAGGETIYEYTITNSDRTENTVEITKEEFLELTTVLHQHYYDIDDRSVIAPLKADGLSEIEHLVGLNITFGNLCDQYYETNQVATVFDNLIETWCV